MSRTAATHAQHSKTAEGKNIVKYLKRATTFTVPTRPFSHGHDTGFSGSIATPPLVPAEARRRGVKRGIGDEPSSPEVSCIGQVKKQREACMLAAVTGDVSYQGENNMNKKNNRKNSSSVSPSVLSMIFKGKLRRGQKATATVPQPSPVASAPAPSIGQMKRFTSGRDALCGFDWKMDSGIDGHEGGGGSSYYFSADEGEREEEEGQLSN